MRILPSANKHGITDAEIWHAIRNQTGEFQGRDELVMIIGPALSGALLEVGIEDAESSDPRIIHAMPARAQYLPSRKGKKR